MLTIEGHIYMSRQLSVFTPLTVEFGFQLLSKEMIDEADRDGDGEVNEEEFLRIMKKLVMRWEK